MASPGRRQVVNLADCESIDPVDAEDWTSEKAKPSDVVSQWLKRKFVGPETLFDQSYCELTSPEKNDKK